MFSELMVGTVCVWVIFLLEMYPSGKNIKWSICKKKTVCVISLLKICLFVWYIPLRRLNHFL